MDQQTIAELEIALAEKAERMRKNLLGEYFRSKRELLFQNFIECDARDIETLRDIKSKTDALDDLEADIQNIIDGGKMAQASLAESDKLN